MPNCSSVQPTLLNMRFLLTIADDRTPAGWPEKHEFNCEVPDEAQPFARGMVDAFNSGLRPDELPRRLLSVVVAPPDCDWHASQEEPLRDEEQPGCQGCDRIFHVKDCEVCGRSFLDPTNRSFDDFSSGVYVTSSGDVYCTPCGRRHDQAQEEADAEEPDYFRDPYDPS